MHRSYHRWFSPALGRDMELLLFGHAGAPVVVFPTSQGRFFEYEDRGMVGALSEHLEQGWIQLICVDSVDSESFYCRWAHPGGRIWRHVQYENYLLGEVIPAVRGQNSNSFWMTTGCSFGAYHAVNLALKHPHVIRRTIGLSGVYDIRRFLDGFYNDHVYFNNPLDYTANLHDRGQIDRLKQQDIILATGEDDPNRWSNDRLSAQLWRADVGHAYRLWDGWAHDWPWWQQMIRHYIGGHD
ncbi:MAG: esterase [Chloroflexi bacterium]|nr:MAG: esterase [Chloroflexota bacterium]